jgi:porphobilinogen deaminase
VGAWGRFEQDRLLLDAVVLSHDGVSRLAVSDSAAGDPLALGERVAQQLLAQGAADLISQARGR